MPYVLVRSLKQSRVRTAAGKWDTYTLSQVFQPLTSHFIVGRKVPAPNRDTQYVCTWIYSYCSLQLFFSFLFPSSYDAAVATDFV